MTWEDVIEYEKRDSYEDGKKSGLEQGINALISTCRELGVSNEETIAKLMEKFSLTEDEATEKVTNN